MRTDVYIKMFICGCIGSLWKKNPQIRDSQTCTLSEPSFLTSTKKKTKVREEKEEEKLQ